MAAPTGPGLAPLTLPAWPIDLCPGVAQYFDTIPKYFHPIIELEKRASGCWLLQAISILPEYRGMGYAKHLLSEVESIAKNTGVSKIALQVEDENTIALGFYKKNNYVEIDRRPVIPFPGSKDGGYYILMCKDLNHS